MSKRGAMKLNRGTYAEDKLPPAWRASYERSYGCGLEHVSLISGPEVDRHLVSANAIAQMLDSSLVLLSRRFFAVQEPIQYLVLGHEIAHTLQLGRGGTDSETSLEAEAWRAAVASVCGQRYKVRGGAPGPLFARLLYGADQQSDPVIGKYFQQFPQLGTSGRPIDVRVTSSRQIWPRNFDRLMRRMIASRQRDFVIVAHGHPLGLTMPLAAATQVSATHNVLFALMAIDEVGRRRRRAGNHLRNWQAIVRYMRSPRWRTILTRWPLIEPHRIQPNNVQSARAEIERVLDAMVDVMIGRRLPLRRKWRVVNRLIGSMHTLRRQRIRKIVFVGCDLGKVRNPTQLMSETMRVYREFFDAQDLFAPKVDSAFGWCTPTIGAGAVAGLNNPLHERVFVMAGERVKFVIEPIPNTLLYKVRCAAESRTALRQWVRTYLMSNSPYSQGKLRIHALMPQVRAGILGLQTQSAVFPRERSYEQNIRHSWRHPRTI
jgi:hypothetical protein